MKKKMMFKYYYILEYKNMANGMIYRCAAATNDKNENCIGENDKFKNDWKKYGPEGFRKSILKSCINEEDFKESEKYFLSQGFLDNPKTYNTAPDKKSRKGRKAKRVICEKCGASVAVNVISRHKCKDRK